MALRLVLLLQVLAFPLSSESSLRGDVGSGSRSEEEGRAILSLEEYNGLDETSRRLFGSNCIRIETGNIPVYYDCLGCIIEQANACVDDLRYNLTGVIHLSCAMNSLIKTSDFQSMSIDAERCCPRFHELFTVQGFSLNKLDMSMAGSGYPVALRCIQNAGCGGHLIYQQLDLECLQRCSHRSYEKDALQAQIAPPDGKEYNKGLYGVDPRKGRNANNVCYADFNSAPLARASLGLAVLAVAVGSALSSLALW